GRYTAASAIVEAADRLTEDDGGAHAGGGEQFALLVGALRSLARGEHPSGLIVDSYLLRAMALSGWAPGLDECARCGAPGPHQAFVAQLGGTVCGDCAPVGSVRVDADTSSLLRALMAGEWDVVDDAPAGSIGAASGLIAAYAQWHLERGIRSLEHVSAAPEPQRAEGTR
ncbi:MAG: DNA repair protein RecO, partial [Microbacterium sp.]|nr:DNA repair protein RecO [Microbacterium sp.]